MVLRGYLSNSSKKVACHSILHQGLNCKRQCEIRKEPHRAHKARHPPAREVSTKPLALPHHQAAQLGFQRSPAAMGADEQPPPAGKRQREEESAEGNASEKRPRADESEGASLLGLANYTDEEEDDGARGRVNGRPREEEDGVRGDVNGGPVEDEAGDNVRDEEEDERRAPERRPRQVELRRDCPYLDTVNRQV